MEEFLYNFAVGKAILVLIQNSEAIKGERIFMKIL